MREVSTTSVRVAAALAALLWALAAPHHAVTFAQGAPPSPAGAWESELGRVTITDNAGALSGGWEGPGGRRGQITAGRLAGSTLTLEYVTAENVRGVGVFGWNGRSLAWEGNWRHYDGRMGGWNLRRGGGDSLPGGTPSAPPGATAIGPVRILEVLVEPATARAGDSVNLVVRYEITGANVSLTEVRRILAGTAQKGIWRDEKTLGAGIHRSSRTVQIGASTRPGQYQFRGEVQVGQAQAGLPASFTIAGGAR